MIRFSFSFQHETPVRLQTEVVVVVVDEVLAMVQVERRESGSVREFLRPSRQVMSSSMAKQRNKFNSRKREKVRKTRLLFMAELRCF